MFNNWAKPIMNKGIEEKERTNAINSCVMMLKYVFCAVKKEKEGEWKSPVENLHFFYSFIWLFPSAWLWNGSWCKISISIYTVDRSTIWCITGHIEHIHSTWELPPSQQQNRTDFFMPNQMLNIARIERKWTAKDYIVTKLKSHQRSDR